MTTNTAEYYLDRARGELSRRRMNEVIGSLLSAVELLQAEVKALTEQSSVPEETETYDEPSEWGPENQASYEASVSAGREAGIPGGQPLENKTDSVNSNIEITLSAVVDQVQQAEPAKRGRGRPRKL